MGIALIDLGVKALLTPIIPGSVFAGIAPEDQRAPFITYQRVGEDKIRDINGPSGLARTIFQVDVYAAGYLQSKEIAKAVRLALDGFSGNVTIDSDSVQIGGISFQDGRDFEETDVNPKLYRASVDYLFKYEEEI